MRRIKLFEDFSNENLHIKQLGANPSLEDVAKYCYDNYAEITGLDQNDRDEEMLFPEEMIINKK